MSGITRGLARAGTCVVSATLALLMGCTGGSQPAPERDRPDDGRMTLVEKTPDVLGYAVRLPAGYTADEERRFPALVFLHGLGEVGDGSAAALQHLVTAGLPKLAAARKLPPTARQFIILAPQTPVPEWRPEQVRAWLTATLPRYRIDADRLYLTGMSMGGGGAVTYLDTYAAKNEFAAAVLVSEDWTPTPEPMGLPSCEHLSHTPIWAFAGDLDATVPHELSVNLVSYLNTHCRLAQKARVTVLLSTFHNAWDKVYDLSGMDPGSTDVGFDGFDPDVYSWLLSHRLSTRERT
jgi:predicted peptidase